MISPTRPPRTSGFTLLEVILAITILAGSIAALGEVSRMAMRSASESRDLARAQMLAETTMAQIEAGIISTGGVDKVQFDGATESLAQGQAPWVYSIKSDAANEAGLLSVRVTVTRDVPAAQHPVTFTLVRWLPDPSYTYSPPPLDASASISGGT